MSGVESAGVIGGDGQDVFDEHEADPAKCRAIESSLWELESLRHHYYHAVSYMLKSLLGCTWHACLHLYNANPCLCTQAARFMSQGLNIPGNSFARH